MRKVTVKLDLEVVMSVNEGIEIAEVIQELDCRLIDTTTEADVIDVQIVNHEIIDSK